MNSFPNRSCHIVICVEQVAVEFTFGLVIMTYALCGFANFGSLGIMIGGMGSMVPERQDEIVSP